MLVYIVIGLLGLPCFHLNQGTLYNFKVLTYGNGINAVSRYLAAGNCFQETRYPSVRNFNKFSRNSSFNSSKNIRYLFRNLKRL